MKKILFIILFLFLNVAFSQNKLIKYPDGQSPYEGGTIQMFKEINSYLIKEGLVPCLKNEIYMVNLLIDENGRPSLVVTEKNRNTCAYNLVVKALSNLKKWKPAQVDGVNKPAYFDFAFVSDHYFENFKDDYDVSKITKTANYEGGINLFTKQLFKNLHGYLGYDTYLPTGKFLISFIVNKEGKISNIDIEPKLDKSGYFLEDVKYSILKVKNKWNPTIINNIPVNSKFRFYIDFNEIVID